MTRPRIAAAVLTLLAFGGLLILMARLQPEETTTLAAPVARSYTTTTAKPDFAALVMSGAQTALPTVEQDLTEEALTRATSTTTTLPPTTTTTQPATTTTASAPATTTAPATPQTTAPPATSPPTTSAGGFVSSAESDFASKINSQRGSSGSASLSRHGSLDSYARSWAKKMAKDGALSHSSIGSLLGSWSSVGENVGAGGSVGGIFDALVSSSGHRDNMLAEFTHLGVGVWQDAQGVLWTCHVFAR